MTSTNVCIYNALWYAKWIDEIYATFNLPNPWASTSQRKHVKNNQKNLSLFKIVKGCYFGQSCGSSRWKGLFMGWPSWQLFKSCCLQWCQQINFPASQTRWSTQKPNHGNRPNQPTNLICICHLCSHPTTTRSQTSRFQIGGPSSGKCGLFLKGVCIYLNKYTYFPI